MKNAVEVVGRFNAGLGRRTMAGSLIVLHHTVVVLLNAV